MLLQLDPVYIRKLIQQRPPHASSMQASVPKTHSSCTLPRLLSSLLDQLLHGIAKALCNMLCLCGKNVSLAPATFHS